MNRRGFLKGLFGAGVACTAASMPLVLPERRYPYGESMKNTVRNAWENLDKRSHENEQWIIASRAPTEFVDRLLEEGFFEKNPCFEYSRHFSFTSGMVIIQYTKYPGEPIV